MIEKTIQCFDYDELTPEVKEKALKRFNEENGELPALKEWLEDNLNSLLEKNNIVPQELVKPTLFYSLSNCQGDGVCFTGQFKWKQYSIFISNANHRYSHSHSTNIEVQESNNLGYHMDDEHKDVKLFDSIYQVICASLERIGYEYIEDEQSEESFISCIEANDWHFTKDGQIIY